MGSIRQNNYSSYTYLFSLCSITDLRRPTALPGIGSPNWFYLTLLAPYAGLYYWRSGDRVDDIKVKLAESDDAMLNEVTIEGNDDELERMWRTLDLREKGMVKVEGLLESA